VRGGRLSISPLELDAAAVASIRERVPEALYETSKRTLSLRVPDEAAARLGATTGLVGALAVAEPAFSESR
jgi:transcription-repair coupling factor (superfamily II helicase)